MVHLAADPQAVGDQVVHPGQAVEADRAGQLGVDQVPGQVAHLGQRAGLHRPAGVGYSRLRVQAVPAIPAVIT